MTYFDQMKRSVGFFARDEWQQPNGAIPSMISAKGEPLDSSVHTVAFGRLIYGLSHISRLEPRCEAKARKAIEFQLTNMIGGHRDGPYFRPAVSFSGEVLEDESKLDFWQQSYGLTGLTEFYRVTGDEDILAQIHRLHDAFIHRFRDPVSGGLVNEVALDGCIRSKARSFMSLIYPVTAFLLNLAMSDHRNEERYVNSLIEHLRIAVDKPVWNDKVGWVNVEFDENWLVGGEVAPDRLGFNVYPGHCFQLCWFLLKVGSLPFVPKDLALEAKALAMRIANRILAQPCWDGGPVGGFFAAVDPNDNSVTDNTKQWWQHCEAIIALGAMRDQHDKALEELKAFYFKNFLDQTYGGEYFTLDANNNPDPNAPKGEKGKSVYHHIEMLRYLQEDEG